MSINPATDIVLDVARAADPARYRRAAAKLDATDGSGFADTLAAAEASVPAGPPVTVPPPQHAPVVARHEGGAGTGRAADTYRQFEAMALANMLESAMPSSENFFGKGVAGDTWKSMLIDQIATQMAKRGGVGIADELARTEAGRRTGQLAAAGQTVPAKPNT
jgi:flagellar protein FlgJ